MIPAMKFLKHKPRGLKNIKEENDLPEGRTRDLTPLSKVGVEAETKKITPLQFKKR